MLKIKDKEYKEIFSLFVAKNELEEKLKEVKKQYEALELSILSRMEEGEEFNWCWKYETPRINIPWKEKFIEYASEDEAKRIMAETPPTKTPHIGIEGIHSKFDSKYKPVLEVKPKSKK